MAQWIARPREPMDLGQAGKGGNGRVLICGLRLNRDCTLEVVYGLGYGRVSRLLGAR
jgi:hypothetical protein